MGERKIAGPPERIEKAILVIRGQKVMLDCDSLSRKSLRPSISPFVGIGHTVCDQSREPGQLHPNLAWTHYRTLLRVIKVSTCVFYEIEAVRMFAPSSGRTSRKKSLPAAINYICPRRRNLKRNFEENLDLLGEFFKASNR
jgi:hypothetical protein